jgi:hypothetical protein
VTGAEDKTGPVVLLLGWILDVEKTDLIAPYG